jgi:hypothetical protein
MTNPLITRLIEGSGEDYSLNREIYSHLIGVPIEPAGFLMQYDGARSPIRNYTSSLDACVRLAEQVLPGWYWGCGLCGLTGDGSVRLDKRNYAHMGPDCSKPILTEQQLNDFDSGFHYDLPPGDSLSRVCRALLCCIIEAKEAMEESNGPI